MNAADSSGRPADAPAEAAAAVAIPPVTRATPTSAAPPVPQAARRAFGRRLGLAVGYAEMLADEGVLRGMIGPREIPRLWERHLLNSAVLAELLPPEARLVDIGAGAGLPGVPLAICRPDLRVDLVEPMLRRTAFLHQVVERLGLTNSRVVRGRAEDRDVRELVAPTDWIVARAVAPLVRLVEWCMPLLSTGGCLLALKGERAADEIATAAQSLRKLGAADPILRRLGAGLTREPTWVVEVRRSIERPNQPRRTAT